MKKVFLAVMICVMSIIGFVAFKFLNETEKRLSPQATVTFKNEELGLKINYSRPYMNGRQIFGHLVQYDQYWRTGADEATEITLSDDVTFGGESISAGSYRLYSIPGKELWTIVLNSELGQWGAFEPNYDLDVARIETSPKKLDTPIEQLTISVEDAENGVGLVVSWEDQQIVVPIQ